MESNDELRRIFEADQADRRGEMPPDIWARDRERRERVDALLSAGAVRTAEDHLRAAFVFQHGDKLSHYWQAHELALQAVDLGHGPPARWLAAAAYDRWLMHQGLPQKFGTQYRLAGDRYVLHEVDPATSDEDRARWDVPPLARALEKAEELTRMAAGAAGPAARAAPAQLAAIELPGLRVALVGVAGEEAIYAPDAMPAPEPLEPGPHPLPGHLPAGLEARRLGEGYCAVDGSGQFQLTWIELHLPPGETLHLVWNTDEGPPPPLVALSVGARQAAFLARAWSAVSPERLPLLALRSGPDSCWLVSGRLAPDELAAVAATLPGVS